MDHRLRLYGGAAGSGACTPAEAANKNPFESALSDKFYFAAVRSLPFKDTLKSGHKWVKNKINGNPVNPLKLPEYIQQLSPPFRNANELGVDACADYAKQACICRSSMNMSGSYERTKKSQYAHYLLGIVALHGGYDLHAAESLQSVEKMANASRAAKTFLERHIPEEIRSIIEKGNGAFIDQNTGLCVIFLFEHAPKEGKPILHIVFPGTGSAGNIASHASADIAVVTGSSQIPPSFIQASRIVEMMMRCVGDNATIEVKGFSLGGAIAAYAGLANELKTTTLSPLALSPAMWKDLVDKKGEQLATLVEQKITNLTVEGDFACGHGKIQQLARKTERALSWKMPHILGKTYVVAAGDFPENYTRTPGLGYGVHTSSSRIWVGFYEKKRQGEGEAKTKAHEIAIEVAADSSAHRQEQAEAKHLGAEYEFLSALAKAKTFHLNSGSQSRKITSQASALYSRYSQLNDTEKLAAVTDLEQKLIKLRNGSMLDKCMPFSRKLYAAVVCERNRLCAPPEGGWPIGSLELALKMPHEQSKMLLYGTAAAATQVTTHSTIRNELVMTRNNAVLPRIFKTGDEIGPAAYALIANAKKSVKLQTYLFYEKSESAKWLHMALNELQQKQRAKRAAGQEVAPIEVEILMDDARGLARQNLAGNGGRFQHANVLKGRKEILRQNQESNYGIGYPAKLDPTLIKVTVKGLKHFQRGTLHSKTLLVDDEHCLLSTNNFKGTHHKISMDGEVRFDAGMIFSGHAAQAVADDHTAMSGQIAANILGSNIHEPPFTEENQTAYSLEKKYLPAALNEAIKPWEWQGYDAKHAQHHAEQISAEVTGFQEAGRPENALEMVVISKPANNALYAKTSDSPQRNAYLHAMRAAKSYIRITNVNLNVQEVIDALVAAVERGVKVEILLPDDAMEIPSAMDAKTNLEAYHELQSRVDALGKSDLLDLRWEASSFGKMPHKGKNHAKYMNVDGVAFFGSTNLDVQSWKYSAELNIAMADPASVQSVDKTCFIDLFQHGIPFKTPPLAAAASKPVSAESPKKQGRAPGHAGTIVSVTARHVAKLTSEREAQAYREFGEILQDVVSRHRTVSELLLEHDNEETRAALRRLPPLQPGKEVIVLDKIGARIPLKDKQELDIKVGQTMSYRQAKQYGRPQAFTKFVKQLMLGVFTGTQSISGKGRHYRMVGVNHNGRQLGKGRTLIGRRTNRHLAATFELHPEQRNAHITKIRSDLERIRQRLAQAPVTFIGSSVLIAIDEKNPHNTEVKLIDLAYPVKQENAHEYAIAARQLDTGIANLIEECKRLQDQEELQAPFLSEPSQPLLSISVTTDPINADAIFDAAKEKFFGKKQTAA